ncbi:MAG: hypothetical protein ACW7DU_13480, partial [Paraglaciecola chathamensis]
RLCSSYFYRVPSKNQEQKPLEQSFQTNRKRANTALRDFENRTIIRSVMRVFTPFYTLAE